MATGKIYGTRTALTGGGAGALDALDGAALNDKDIISVYLAGYMYWYWLNAASAAAEVSPAIISPDTNAGDKRWILLSAYTNKVFLGNLLTMGSSVLDATNKDSYILGYHYTIAEENIAILRYYSFATTSIIRIGGGLASCNAATQLDFCAAANNTTTTGSVKMSVTGTGVGIGTAAPASPCAVNREADDGVIIGLEQGDVVEGTISVSGTTVSYNAFVGSHYTQLKNSQVEPPVGAVMCSTGDIIPCEKNKTTKTEVSKESAITVVTKEQAKERIPVQVEDKNVVISETTTYEYDPENDIEKPTTVTTYGTKEVLKNRIKKGFFHDKETREFFKINNGFEKEDEKFFSVVEEVVPAANKEYFVYVKPTTTAGDAKVYGVWVGKMTDDSNGHSFGKNNKPIYLVAQVGLFKIRVTDTNGNIANGDFLETSTREFEAQKQTGANKTKSTIGKSVTAVDWATVAADPVLGYKWQLIPCIF